MADSETTTAAPAPAATVRPTRPDEALFNENLKKAQKEYDEVMTRFNAIKAKIELAQPNKNKDSQNPTQKRRAELIAQLQEIRQKQTGGKNARTTKLDQIKRLDEQMKSRIAEQKAAKGKVSFKSAEDVDREIARLEAQVNSGMMKLVDEKKALAEISSLRKTRKNFAQFDDAEKQISDLKAKIKEIKDSMEDPEAKALNEQYNKLQKELDGIKAEQDEAYKSLSSLRDERTKLHNEQNEKYQAVRKLKDEYHTARKAFAEYEKDRRAKDRERQQAERDRIAKERRMERAQKMLAEASDPAYLEEIRRANSLLHFFDPSHVVEKSAPLLTNKGLGAEAQRKVDASGIKGTVLPSKKDREEDLFAPVKKGKKGKKAAPAEAASKHFNVPPSVIEDCAFIGVDPPMSAADVPAVTEKVKAKLENWKKEQPEQTKRNIEKAKKEIERLEAEESGAVSGTVTPNGTNGKKAATPATDDKDVAEVTEGVNEVAVEDKKEEEETVVKEVAVQASEEEVEEEETADEETADEETPEQETAEEKTPKSASLEEKIVVQETPEPETPEEAEREHEIQERQITERQDIREGRRPQEEAQPEQLKNEPESNLEPREKEPREKETREKETREPSPQEEPVVQEPLVTDHVVNESIEKPSIQQPLVQESLSFLSWPNSREPVANDSTEEPSVQRRLVRQSLAFLSWPNSQPRQPVVEEFVVEELVTKEPFVQQALVHEPVVEETSVVEPPFQEELVLAKPLLRQSAVQQPSQALSFLSWPNSLPQESLSFKPLVLGPFIRPAVSLVSSAQESLVPDSLPCELGFLSWPKA